LTLSGSVGLEGIFYGKRVGVLSNNYYSFFPGVKKLEHPDEIFDYLADELADPALFIEERKRFAASFIQSCFLLGEGVKNSPWPPPEIAGVNFARAIERFVDQIKKFKLSVSTFAIEA